MTNPNNDTAQLYKDHTRLRAGILEVHLAWAELENKMATLLERIVGNPERALGFAIYFTPGSAETRFNIVDSTVCAFIDGLPREADIAVEWQYLKSQIDRSRAARNRVVHGNIVTIHTRKNYARLAPAIFDFRRSVGQRRKSQIPGMSPHDVDAVAQKILYIRSRISTFVELINALRHDDERALQDTLLELRALRQNPADHQKDDQTPPTPPSPPRSSRA